MYIKRHMKQLTKARDITCLGWEEGGGVGWIEREFCLLFPEMIIDLCCRNTVFPPPWRPMLVYQSIVARLHNNITSGYLISAHSLNLSLVHSSVSSVSVSMGILIKLVQRLCRCLDASVEWCYLWWIRLHLWTYATRVQTNIKQFMLSIEKRNKNTMFTIHQTF